MTEITDDFVQWYDGWSVANITSRAGWKVTRVVLNRDGSCTFKDAKGKQVEALVSNFTRSRVEGSKKDSLVARISADRDGFVVYRKQEEE